MPRSVILLATGLFLGVGLGFVLGAGTSPQETPDTMPSAAADIAHDHAAHDHGQDGSHDHKTLTEVGDVAPVLTLSIHPDGPQSRNLHIGVTGFTFDPKGVNGPHVPGHGHAHVYVNGVKMPRAYSPWVQLLALPKGTHEIRVTLNANDHSQLARNGQPIEATIPVVID